MAPSPTATRRASDYDPLALLALVRDVAEFAGAEKPREISMRAWDGARSRSEPRADAPAARRITEHLELPWEKVLDIAFRAPRGQRIALGHALNEQQGNDLTPEYCDYALRLIAGRLGLPTLTLGQYRSERTKLVESDRRSFRHGGGETPLPTEDQISALAGTWDLALANAGLGARLHGGRPGRRAPTTLVEAIDRFFQYTGAVPSYASLNTFARANDIPLPNLQGRLWSSYVEEWKAERRAKGLRVPRRPNPGTRHPDYNVDLGAGKPGETRHVNHWDDRDVVIDCMVRFLTELPAGERPTLRRYSDWRRATKGVPWPSSFEVHGGFTAVCEAAQRRMNVTRLRGSRR